MLIAAHALATDSPSKTGLKHHQEALQNSSLRAQRKFEPSRPTEAGDLKHLIASLLPATLYRNLVDFITHRRSAHI